MSSNPDRLRQAQEVILWRMRYIILDVFTQIPSFLYIFNSNLVRESYYQKVLIMLFNLYQAGGGFLGTGLI